MPNRNKVKILHEKYLRLIYNGKRSSFEDLLEKDNSVSKQHKKKSTSTSNREV